MLRCSGRTDPCRASSDSFVLARPINASTSSCVRLKLSIEKAYTVTALTRSFKQISNVCSSAPNPQLQSRRSYLPA